MLKYSPAKKNPSDYKECGFGGGAFLYRLDPSSQFPDLPKGETKGVFFKGKMFLNGESSQGGVK